MPQTRRQAHEAEHADGAHSRPDALSLSLPEDVDLEALSELLPDTNITSPTSDIIISVYRLLIAQALEGRSIALELDEARAEIDKKEVELDQALQDKETASRDFEEALEGVQNELKEVRQERDQLGSITTLQTQIQDLLSSQNASSSEVEVLKRRVEDTEREKRDLVAVITRLKQDGIQQDEEIQTLRVNLKEARQEHLVLESQVRELRSGETATKFKIESLSQQLQLAQAEAERTNNELTVKSEDFSKYRREKHAELANVQASLDALTETHAVTQTSLKSLQSSHTAQNHQLTQALSRVQNLQGQLADQEATYSSEANSLRRLVTMLEDREKQNKAMLEGLEREWDDHREKSAQKEMALKEEREHERKAREISEKKAEQLEAILNRMERGELPITMRGTPGTPFRTPSSSDLVDGGMLSLSPTVAMASKTQRKGKGFTEVYADYVRLQEEYAAKCAEYDHMDRTLSSVLGQIEERAPILSQQRVEYERLKSEATQLASQLAQAISDRDAQANLVSENVQKLQKSTRENDLLQKQLNDLGRQVQALLREVSRRDDPTIPSDEDLDAMHIVPAEDTEAVITNHLVLFKSVGGLQEQNQKLLKIVREMGRKMETEERDYREAMEREQAEAIQEAHAAIQDMASQLDLQKKSSDNLIKAYVKERDALRDMLAKEKAGDTAPVNGVSEQEHVTSAPADVVQELADTQSQFEAYRLEMGIDTSNLQKALAVSQKEASGLAVSLAKANAQLEYLAERHRTDQDQLTRHDRDLAALNKRYQDAYDRFTRAEIESNRATEELQVVTGRFEQLRNDCANLKAEKKVSEGIQNRLVEENKTLALERSKLSDLMSNVQKMHNDLERSGENDRRRLESQLQGLESQTSDLRVQLSQERDNIRHLTLQKEIELKELQMRIDKSLQEHSKTREALVGAETSKKHLEERVEELTRQQQGNEEKLAVYERHSSGSSGVGPSSHSDLPHEQQLEAEVAELRSTLRVTEVDLATARNHVQQFQEISRANEEALANLNNTFDEYKMTMEGQIARHESHCQALKEKLEAAEGQLTELTVKYNDLQRSFEAERVAWANDKKTLEGTIVDMSTSEKNSESDRTSRENEVRQQEERARAAEERYSNEVIAHAESMKTIENLKRDLVAAQATSRENLTAAETAKVNLTTSESSWKHQREALEKEIADLTARTQDLNSQNALLHSHLESVSNQANRIKLAAESSSSGNGEGDGPGDVDTKLSELRSVVSYLRKEKEIVDLQLELSKQENSRLKAQVDYLSQSLEDVRATLSEEREKAVETAASAVQHAELLERINQLNLLRESNATLRADSERHAKRARELDSKLKQLSQELDPAKEQARLAQAELQACKAQIGRLEEEGRKWQERNAQLLSKYDRIDPAEVAALRDEIEQLNSQKAELERQKIEADQASSGHSDSVKVAEERIKTLEENIRKSEETVQKVRDHVKRNLTIFNNKLASADAQKKALEEEKSKLLEKVNELEKTISDHQQAPNDAANPTGSSEEIVSQAATIVSVSSSSSYLFYSQKDQASLLEERDKLLAEKTSWEKQHASVSADSSTTDEAKSAWEVEKASLLQARDEALTKLKVVSEEAAKVTEEAKNFKRQSEKFQARISDMMKAKAAEEERQAGLPKPESSGLSEEAAKQHAEELRALEMRLVASHQKELAAAREAAVAGLKANSSEDKDKKDEIASAVSAAIAEHEKTWTAKQATEIEAAIERGRMEQVAKGKLKDAQLVRAQKKVKDLEAQILEWRTAGLVPEVVPATPTTTTTPSNPITAASTSNAPAPSAAKATAASTTNAPVPPAAKSTTATPLPRKPSLGPASAGTVVRGGAVPRGMRVPPRGGMGRGVASRPAAPAAAAAAAAASTGGVSIIGAANKRPREPEPPASDDSLAKRLKPADGTTTPKPPVTIRRPAPGPPA
ncbi:hypothetical protein C0992_005042 [Termitomyces sp. T32_za158]|nr:hypothetical protein C0992_005042 [Termitomyces sp. T32_za158]